MLCSRTQSCLGAQGAGTNCRPFTVYHTLASAPFHLIWRVLFHGHEAASLFHVARPSHEAASLD